MTYETINVKFEEAVCHIQIDRPDAGNTIDDRLVAECNDALSRCRNNVVAVVFSGTKEVFCLGADFRAMVEQEREGSGFESVDPDALYDLWLRMATGPFVTVCDVRGKAQAGGIGFVAACDIVIADESAQFGLSEMLFRLFPACVLPFLTRRIGVQQANFLTLTCQTINAERALALGLVDIYEKDSRVAVTRTLQHLRRLSIESIARYKRFMVDGGKTLHEMKGPSTAANREIFSNPDTLRGISNYILRGIFPWEE